MITRRSVVPSWWAMLFLAACCVLSMVITYRAGAQNAGTTTPAGAPATTPPADAPKQTTTAPAKSTRAPPSKQEESASIPDDPTLVPDDKESADNNVTFPIDI
jgi:uncharacterized iron-regulated membrane protein